MLQRAFTTKSFLSLNALCQNVHPFERPFLHFSNLHLERSFYFLVYFHATEGFRWHEPHLSESTLAAACSVVLCTKVVLGSQLQGYRKLLNFSFAGFAASCGTYHILQSTNFENTTNTWSMNGEKTFVSMYEYHVRLCYIDSNGLALLLMWDTYSPLPHKFQQREF